MNTSSRLLLFAGIGVAAFSSLFGQVTFTDPLNHTSGSNWNPQMQNRGLVYFPSAEASVQGLIFMNYGSPTTASDTGVMTLKSSVFSASAAADWSAQVNVQLSAITLGQNLLTSSQYVNLNLSVSKADDATTYATLALSRSHNGSAIVHGFGGYLTTSGSTVQVQTPVPSATEFATLRFSYDMSEQSLIYAYDATGPADGLSFTTFATQTLVGWGLENQDSFLFSLVGSSGASAGSGPDFSTLAPGYFQNFEATGVSAAVPEPSTYAGLAGLTVLAVAIWRRRAARSSPDSITNCPRLAPRRSPPTQSIRNFDFQHPRAEGLPMRVERE